MSGHVRFHESDGIHFITHRTHQARYLFKPGEETNRILKGCLCRAAAICNIDVFAFVYMSNHFHLVVRAPEMNLSKFMAEHNGEIVRRINVHRDGRTGSVFDGNYSDPQILDEPTMRDKIGYTLCNPVEARAVSHPDRWPGLCSLNAHRSALFLDETFRVPDLRPFRWDALSQSIGWADHKPKPSPGNTYVHQRT